MAKKKNEIIVNLDELQAITIEGGQLMMKPNAESALVYLIELEKKVAEAMKMVKSTLQEEANKIDPNMASVQGDNIKVNFVASGSKYKITTDDISTLPDFLYKAQYRPDGKAVEVFEKEHGHLPTGIEEIERTKSVRITLKKK